MTDSRLVKMAQTIAQYSLNLKPGEQVLVLASVPALPFVREFFVAALKAGALPFVRTINPELDEVLYRYGSDEQIGFVPASDRLEIETCSARLAIRGDENLATLAGVDPARLAIARKARKPLMDTFMERKGRGELKACLTQYPTNASAQQAGMSLADYADFVFSACFCDQPDPIAAWQKLSAEQQHYVDFLNSVKTLRVEGPGTDLTVSVDGRKWVNSDGKANFPSGEVFTGPVEDSAEGRITFDVPTMFQSHPVESIEFEFQAGKVVKASAARGNDMLQSALDTDERSRYLGEFAFGLNYGVTRATRNILFDEKMGGTIHLAIGAAYPETGSANRSAIHWDMIKDMKEGRVYADGKLVYEGGRFKV
ncbi:aminopeptidase, partial [candidate division WOR-3 bacterium]|nr:aminopeptidase [candidate division WOR-3 bacterium]